MTTKRAPVPIVSHDKYVFRHTAKTTKALNVMSVLVSRGGIRL